MRADKLHCQIRDVRSVDKRSIHSDSGYREPPCSFREFDRFDMASVTVTASPIYLIFLFFFFLSLPASSSVTA